jgi:hypothetical protein
MNSAVASCRVSANKKTAITVIGRCYIIRGQNLYDFMDRLNGIPKIALRKSGTKT